MMGKENIFSSDAPSAKLSRHQSPRCGQRRHSRPGGGHSDVCGYSTFSTHSAQIEMFNSAVKWKENMGITSRYQEEGRKGV